MKAFKKKWNSQQGASVMMALLLMLVCMMAGASILMAAAANIGKINSNKIEQQNYLTLSSALNLLVDELVSTVYKSEYSYTLKDENGNTISDSDLAGYGVSSGDLTKVHTHTYNQQPGSLTGDWLKDVLPLNGNMDYVFAQNFKVRDSDTYWNHDYIYYTQPTSEPESVFQLELTADVDESYGGLAGVVEIMVQLEKTTGVITLRASLKDYPEYIMEAVLKPAENLSDSLALKRIPEDGKGSVTVEWELDHISKIEVTTPEPSPTPLAPP